eukprot:11744650-Ditylum_brightwellii.AAC.2
MENYPYMPLKVNSMDELYNNLPKRAGKRGLEESQSRGSQGHCKLSPLVQKYLHDPGAFPRHANSILIIILNSKQKCGYFRKYLCPFETDGTLKKWFYNVPQFRITVIPYQKVCQSVIVAMLDEVEEAETMHE